MGHSHPSLLFAPLSVCSRCDVSKEAYVNMVYWSRAEKCTKNVLLGSFRTEKSVNLKFIDINFVLQWIYQNRIFFVILWKENIFILMEFPILIFSSMWNFHLYGLEDARNMGNRIICWLLGSSFHRYRHFPINWGKLLVVG